MASLISRAIAHLKTWLNQLQVKQCLTVVLVGVLLLTTNMGSGKHNQGLTQQVLDRVHQNESQRPKTTGEWNQEARETAGRPEERRQRIGNQSGEAFKEFGSGYVDATKNAAQDAIDRVTPNR